jgi:hypothetical protein
MHGRRKRHGTESMSVEAELDEALSYLEGLGANRDKMLRRLLGGIGTAARAQVRKAYRSQGLSKGTGALYKSISRRVIRSGKAVIVEAKAASDQDKVFYGYALAKGARITARDGGWLTFQKDGKWVRVHEVKLPERDFVAAPVKEYLLTTAFKAKLDQLVQREVARIEKEKKR